MNKLSALIYMLGTILSFIVCLFVTLKVNMLGLDWAATCLSFASILWYWYMLLIELHLELDRDDMPKIYYHK